MKPRSVRRRWRAGLRDTLLLVREFRRPLLLFMGAMAGAGLLYESLARDAGASPVGPAEAVYRVITLTVLQPSGPFPEEWYLQVFYLVMPLLGVAFVALGLSDFGVMLFSRQARSREWEMAVASTFKDHVVLVGLGHLGYWVVRQLREMDREAVVVERNPESHLQAQVRAMDTPVVHGDANREEILEAAGIRRAHTILVCTQNDAVNLQIALRARSLNPGIRVVVRIFDEDFAAALTKQFGFVAISATAMAAPAFAAAAAGVEMTHPITVEGHALSLARFPIAARAPVDGRTVSEVETDWEVSLVAHIRGSELDFHPAAGKRLHAGDTIVALGSADGLTRLVQGAARARAIISGNGLP